MRNAFSRLAFAAALSFGAVAAHAQALMEETPSLAADVAAGKLPAIDGRLPSVPLVEQAGVPGIEPGRQGGELRMLMGRAQDVRMANVYGYARLVRYNAKFEIVPDLLQGIDNEGDKVFTLHLRPGHRWSDGKPFTSEDFRYWWEDVINNKQLQPSGPPKDLMSDGKGPKVEFVDATTIRYSWATPNPAFLPALAGASPVFIYRPAHYMKQFHQKYADEAALKALVEKAKVRSWTVLHNRTDASARNDNPDQPTLDPWVVTTRAPSERFVFTRNPYFHRVDAYGHQLPYIDRLVMSIADGRIIPAKTGAGESDIQARYLTFNNYTFLRQAAKRNSLQVHLWDTARGAQVALYPNLNVADPVWKALNRDVRFRRALSLAINRHEINQVIYFGLAVEGNNTVLPNSPLYKQAYREQWARFDLKEANRLLDELGLTKRDSRGVRLLPNGKPLEVIVETAGEETEQTDVLELVHDSWLAAGVKLFSKPSQREVFRTRIYSGETMMSIWFGVENGLPNAGMSPAEFAPTVQDQLQWPKWGQFIETKGASGETVDDPPAMELAKLNDQWAKAGSEAERTAIWEKILTINADQVYSIGMIAGIKQPVVVSSRVRNVPAAGIYNFEPGAFFGVYRPDLWWIQNQTAALQPGR
jgi:peptide/nickel transport system substrate-binding protein